MVVTCAVGVVCAMCAACATVAPYERETLARRDMTLEASPELDTADDHAVGIREGAAGGARGAGGGCGCN